MTHKIVSALCLVVLIVIAIMVADDKEEDFFPITYFIFLGMLLVPLTYIVLN